ncbi:MAG: MFS transporter [Saccharospirillum sp.]|nr:MFS transporter [Saccharospirillum sp.]
MTTINDMPFREKALRLSPMYAAYFTLFGVFTPYLARFLTAQGLTAQEIGVIVAMVFGVNIFAPFLFSLISDRTGQRLPLIRLGYLLMGVFYLLSLQPGGFYWYLMVFGFYGVFMSAVLPQMEGVVMHVLGADKARYGMIRLWGSAGYVVVVWLLGAALDHFPVTILPIIGGILCGLMWLATWLVPKETRLSASDRTARKVMPAVPIDWFQVVVLLLVVFFWQVAMAPYNTFFDLFLKERGFNASTIGFLISFGSICEIGVFIAIAGWFNRFSERHLLLIALVVTIVRWSLLASLQSSFVLALLIQSMHALTFGVIHSVAIHRIGRLFPIQRQGLGQGLYVSVGMGLGLICGNLLAGYLWTGAGTVFWAAAGFTVLATIIAWFGFGAIRGVDRPLVAADEAEISQSEDSMDR